MSPRGRSFQFFSFLFCCLAYESSLGQAGKIVNDGEFIDTYGISIKFSSNLKLIKPLDKNFFVENLNSRLILPKADTSEHNIQFIISAMEMREKNKSYEIKITSYYFNDQKRPISSPLRRVYEMRISATNNRYVIKELNYELMEW